MARTMTPDELKKAIAALSAVKQQRRYPPELRAEILRHARASIAAGTSRAAVCEALDIGEPTLTRFLNASPAARFRQVRVVDAEPEVRPAISVKGPCGLVIEGLTTAELADLVRRLACSA